jgi:hypothetical protein
MPGGNELVTLKHRRAFVQSGGAGPENTPQYAGQAGPYLRITSVNRERLGGVDGVFNHDPNRVGAYIPVGTLIKTPNLHSFTVEFRIRKGGIPFSDLDFSCPTTFYVVSGECRNLSAFDSGWVDMVKVLPSGIATKPDDGDLNSFDDDKEVMTKIDFVCGARLIYSVGSLTFGALSATLTATPVNAICYGAAPQCSDCGPADDGTKKIYSVATGGAAAKPIVSYWLDGGAAAAQTSSIAVAANAEAPNDILVFGNNLVVLSPTANTSTNGGYYYAPLDPVTGAPGTWVKVTTGFVDNKAPQDMFLQGQTLWIVGKAGYIYKVVDVTAGATVANAAATVTTDLNRIHGDDSTLVATGASGVVLKSTTKGVTWAATTTQPAGASTLISSVLVLSPYTFWVGTGTGTNTGKLYYTRDGGATWTEKSFTGNAAGTVTDIVAPNPECIFFSHNTAAPVARIFASINGGNSFTNTTPRIAALPTFNLATRLATPGYSGPTAAANNVAVAGTASGGTDGLILLGVANIV